MWTLWHGVLSCFKQLHGHTLVIKRWTWPATILRYKLAFKQFSVCSKPLKSQMRKIPHTNISPPPAAWTVHAKQGAFMVFYKMWLDHPNAKVENEAHQTRQYFHNLWFWSARPDCCLNCWWSRAAIAYSNFKRSQSVHIAIMLCCSNSGILCTQSLTS